MEWKKRGNAKASEVLPVLGERIALEAGESLREIVGRLGPGIGEEKIEWGESASPIVVLAHEILMQALDADVSDVHIETGVRHIWIRFRIDGLLQEFLTMPKSFHLPLLAWFKEKAGMDRETRRTPQTGSIPIVYQEHDYRFRAHTLPTFHGESLLLHPLAEDRYKVSGADLGLAPVTALLDPVLSRPTGLVLLAGPRRSGLTTTAYFLLQNLLSVHAKLYTLESVPEYTLPGATPIFLNGYSEAEVAEILETVSHRDADRIFIDGASLGSVRATKAIREALDCGRFVLATITAPDTTAALRRLESEGVFRGDPGTAPVRAVLAQRLVQRICESCRVAYELPSRELARFGFPATDASVTVFRGNGCENCRNTGYRGRVGIFEALIPKSQWSSEAQLSSFEEASQWAILDGVTTPNEIYRIRH